MRARSVLFASLMLATAVAACAAVPSISFDDGGTIGSDDASTGGSDAPMTPDTSPAPDSAPPADASDGGCPSGYFCCAGSNTPCLGQCSPGACGKCDQAACKVGEFCCAANPGTVGCRKLGDPCP